MDTSYTFPTLIPGPYAFGNEKLARLEMLLRTDFETTHKHRWRFRDRLFGNDCGTVGCAIGLADVCQLLSTGDWEIDLNISISAGTYLFLVNHHYNGSPTAFGYGGIAASQVTPIMVADAIRRYMLTGSLT